MTNQLPTIHFDQAILDGLLNNDRNAIDGIYKRLAIKIKNHIITNSGTEEEAGDIFQETIIDIYNQAKQGKLNLTCPFDAFFTLVAKRKWLNHLKNPQKKWVTNADDALLDTVGEDSFRNAEILVENSVKEKIYKEQLNKLSKSCIEIIKSTLQKKPQQEVAEQLNITYNYLRKKKSECLDQLVKNIQTHLKSVEYGF